MSETVEVIFAGKDAGFTTTVKNIQKEMDALNNNLKAAGVSSAAYSKAIDQAKQANMGVIDSVKKFVSANKDVIAMFSAVGATGVKAYQVFQQYAGSVRDVALASGSSAEEASKLIQVLDDYELKANDVMVATKAMTKQGLEPSIDTLAKLADQYVAINDPMQKNEFILKNLGKAGLQWANALSQGGDALRKQSEEVNKSLILTDEQIKKAEQARLAVDAWADAWEGLKVSIGGAIGSMIAANDTHAKAIALLKEEGVAVGRGVENTDAYADAVRKLEYAQLGAARSAEEHGSKLDGDLTPALNDSTTSAEELAKANQTYMSVLGKVSSETEKYTEKNQDLNDKLIELQTQLSNEDVGSGKYKEITGQIEETQAAVTALAEEHDKASKQIIFDLIAQQAASEGFRNISVEALAQIGEQWGVLAAGSGKATSDAISQAEAWSKALEGPVGQLQTLADMWSNLASMAAAGITLTATVVSEATGGAMGGTNTAGSCFTGDTLVTMSDGTQKPIQDVVIGESVLSYNMQEYKKITTKVIEVFKHPANEGGRLLLINGFLKVTEEHLIWNNREWIPARDFVIGDVLTNIDNSWTVIKSIREIPKNEPVYNIHVDHEAHNYYAGGVLVHNAKATSNAAGGQLSDGWNLVGDRPGGGFVPGVSELIYGDTVFSSRMSEKMIKAGLVRGINSLAQPNEDVYTNAPSNLPPPQIKYKSKGGKGAGMSASNSGGGTVSAAGMVTAVQSVSAEMAQTQAQAQNTAIQVQAAVDRMSEDIKMSNRETQSILDRIAGIMLSDNPRAVGKQVAYEVSKAS